METLENTKGAVTKLTYGDGGGAHAPMSPPPSGYALLRSPVVQAPAGRGTRRCTNML